MTDKETVYGLLNNIKKIYLPEIREPVNGGFESIKQESLFIDFDSINMVNSAGSIVDFVITKGKSDVLVGISDGWLSLTKVQRDKIESSGKSFMILRSDLSEDWHSTICFGSKMQNIEIEPFGLVKNYVQTSYWVYHSKWGWQNGAQ